MTALLSFLHQPFLVSSQFDILVQARKLESAVDHRLAAYSKLGTGFSLGGVSGVAGSQAPPELAEVHRRAAEIDGLLQQLAEVNEAMSACAAAGGSGGGSSELQSHTLARHSNILLEFSRVRRYPPWLVVLLVYCTVCTYQCCKQ